MTEQNNSKANDETHSLFQLTNKAFSESSYHLHFDMDFSIIRNFLIVKQRPLFSRVSFDCAEILSQVFEYELRWLKLTIAICEHFLKKDAFFILSVYIYYICDNNLKSHIHKTSHTYARIAHTVLANTYFVEYQILAFLYRQSKLYDYSNLSKYLTLPKEISAVYVKKSIQNTQKSKSNES